MKSRQIVWFAASALALAGSNLLQTVAAQQAVEQLQQQTQDKVGIQPEVSPAGSFQDREQVKKAGEGTKYRHRERVKKAGEETKYQHREQYSHGMPEGAGSRGSGSSGAGGSSGGAGGGGGGGGGGGR